MYQELGVPLPPRDYKPNIAPVEIIEEKKIIVEPLIPQKKDSFKESILEKLSLAKKQRETIVRMYFSHKEEDENRPGMEHINKMRKEIEDKIFYLEEQLKKYN